MGAFSFSAGLLLWAVRRAALPLWRSAATPAQRVSGDLPVPGLVAARAQATWTGESMDIEAGELEARLTKGIGTASEAAAWRPGTLSVRGKGTQPG